MALSAPEREAIILNAIWDSIDGIANLGMFRALRGEHNRELVFESRTSAILTNILLGDFLSLPQIQDGDHRLFGLPTPESDVRPSDRTYLFYLRLVCANPQLGYNPNEILARIDQFAAWLEDSTLMEGVWLSAIDATSDIRIQRIEYFKMCAALGKHNFARLPSAVYAISRILKQNGKDIDEIQTVLALPDFFESFFDDLFIYHAGPIVEFLNNIRWSIFRYVQGEYFRAYQPVDSEPGYQFDIPAGFTDPLARAMYRDLMSRIRVTPCMPEFSISDVWKER